MIFFNQRVLMFSRPQLAPTRVYRRMIKAFGGIWLKTARRVEPDIVVVPDEEWDGSGTEYYAGASWYAESSIHEALGLHLDVHGRLTELRGIDKTRPSTESWWYACQILESWRDDADLEVGLDYVREHFGDWPYGTKRALHMWLRRQLSGRPEPRLSLCTAVDLGIEDRVPLHVNGLKRLLDDPLRHIREINLDGRDNTTIGALADAHNLRALDHVSIANGSCRVDTFGRLMSNPAIRGADIVDARGCWWLQRSAAEPLAAAAQVRNFLTGGFKPSRRSRTFNGVPGGVRR